MDLTVFSEDCFHFSERGHAEMAIALWNNMVSGQGGNLRLFGSVLREDKQVYLRVCVRTYTHAGAQARTLATLLYHSLLIPIPHSALGLRAQITMPGI